MIFFILEFGRKFEEEGWAIDDGGDEWDGKSLREQGSYDGLYWGGM
jgi:hypothetical protein